MSTVIWRSTQGLCQSEVKVHEALSETGDGCWIETSVNLSVGCNVCQKGLCRSYEHLKSLSFLSFEIWCEFLLWFGWRKHSHTTVFPKRLMNEAQYLCGVAIFTWITLWLLINILWVELFLSFLALQQSVLEQKHLYSLRQRRTWIQDVWEPLVSTFRDLCEETLCILAWG